MATFSQGFLANLGRPQMAESLFGLGRAIGGLPGQAQDRRKREQFNQLMQQGQAAMASGDAAQLAQIGQQLAAAGYQKEAQQFSTASREAKLRQDRIAAASGLLGTDPAQAQKSAEAFLGMGDIDTAIKAMDRASELQNRQARNRYATTLAGRARAVGIDLTPDDVLGSDNIGQLAKDVREAELKKIEKTAPKAYRMVRLQEAGFDRNNLPFSVAEINAMPREEFDSFINSQKAELQFFEDQQGNTITARVNKSSGLIENPNYGRVPSRNANVRWLKPESMGLLPKEPVTTSKVFNMNNEVNERLVDLGLSSFEELKQAATGAADTIKRTQQALPLIDEMYTGLGAGAKLNIDRMGELLATSLGMPYDSSKIENTQAYTINRLEEMGNFIQKLGSGTGLSDKDAQIAIQAVAGDTSLDPEVLRRVLNDFITTARFAQDQFQKATGILTRDKSLTQEGMLELIRLTTEVQGTSLTPEQRADAYLSQ